MKRYLGLELGGAKNQRTALAVVQYFPKERKTFLLDVHQHLGADEDRSSDEALVATIREALAGVPASQTCLAANVPLTLPPCFTCTATSCHRSRSCKSTDAQAGRDWLKKLAKPSSKLRGFTPYTQRPVEVWLRHGVLPKFEKRLAFEIDEAMGGTRAPLTARMMVLKRWLPKVPMIEAFPKLTLAALANELSWPARWMESYREMDGGAEAREFLLEALTEHFGVFVYDRDLVKITRNLGSFDAFLCAFTAWLSDQGHCEKPPRGFPEKSGWVEYPKVR